MILRDEAFSGFSVDDISRATDFYSRILGLDVQDAMGGAVSIAIGGGKRSSSTRSRTTSWPPTPC